MPDSYFKALGETKSFTQDTLLILPITPKLNIYYRGTISKDILIDTLLSSILTKEVYDDLILIKRYTKDQLFDTIIAGLRLETYSIDAMLEIMNSRAYDMDSLIQTIFTEELSSDALLILMDLTKDVQTDAYFILQNQIKQHFIDLFLRSTLTSPIDLDAIFTERYFKALNIDSILNLIMTKDQIMDAIIELTSYGNYDIDTLLKTERISDLSINTIIFLHALTSQCSTDACIQLKDQTESIISDSLFWGVVTSSLGIDSIFEIPVTGEEIFYSTSSDGYVQRLTKKGDAETWEAVHSASEGTSVDTTATSYENAHEATAYVSPGQGLTEIDRSFFYFDTSSLPSNCVVYEATFSLYGDTNAESHVCAMKGTQADTLTIADYDSFTGDEYGHTTGTWSITGYNNIVFNAQGRSDINKTGTTKICTREYDHDYLDVDPGASHYRCGSCYSEYTGTDHDPKLFIKYFMPQTRSLAMDARFMPLFERVLKTYLLDIITAGRYKKEQLIDAFIYGIDISDIDIDALFEKTLIEEADIDSIILKTGTTEEFIDIILLGVYSKALITDIWLQKTLGSDYDIDILLRQMQKEIYHVSTLITKKIGKDILLDTILKKYISKELNVDAIIKLTDHIDVYSDAIFKKYGITKSLFIDTILVEKVRFKDYFADALIRGTLLSTLDTDTIITKSIIKELDIDGILSKRFTEDEIIDTLLSAVFVKSILIDTYLRSRSIDTYDIDTLIRLLKTEIYEADIILKKIGISESFYDIFIEKYFTSDLSVNALIQKTLSQSLLTDTLISKFGIEASLLTDMIIVGIGVYKDYFIDSMMLASVTKDFKMDVEIAAVATKYKDLLISAYLYLKFKKSHIIDSYFKGILTISDFNDLLIQKKSVVSSMYIDMIAIRRYIDSWYADIILQGIVGRSYYLDATIGNIFHITANQIMTLAINQSANIQEFKTEYLKDRTINFTTRAFAQEDLINMFEKNYTILLDLSDIDLGKISVIPTELRISREIWDEFSISGIVKQ